MFDDFERIVIKRVLTDREYFSKVSKILKPEYFSLSRKEIYDIILECVQKYDYPNFQDVVIKIKNIPQSKLRDDIVNEIKEIRVTDSDTNLNNLLDETVKFCKDKIYWEALDIGSRGLVERNEDLKAKSLKLIEERDKVFIDSDLGIEFRDLDIIKYYTEDKQGIKTQHETLNKYIGGFLPGTLSLVLASAGVGKSLFMTDLASGFIKQGLNVLLVTLEMSEEEVMTRIHSNVLDIEMSSFIPDKFDKESFERKLQREKTGQLWVKSAPGCTAIQIDGLLDLYRNEKNIEFDVVIVDYLGIMTSSLVRPNVGLYSYIKSIGEELRRVAQFRNIPIISASQLNRGAVNNTSADNANVSDSFGTAMTADLMMFLLQTEEMKLNAEMIVKITKNRFTGKTESFPLRIDYNKMRFIDSNVGDIIGSDWTQKVQETDKIVEEIKQQDAKIAQAFDAKNMGNALDDALNDL